MTQLQARIIIAVDEWLGIALCVFLHERGSSAFWPVFVAFVVLVYGFSYVPYWYRFRRGPPAVRVECDSDQSRARP
jgi:hypothetical protein